MKVVQPHKSTPKQLTNPTLTPKIAPQGPKKSKMTPKLSQNQMSEFKVTQKMKVVQLHEQTPKQILNPTPTQKIAHQGPKKSKITPKLSQNQRSELKETQKMKVIQLPEQQRSARLSMKSRSRQLFQGLLMQLNNFHFLCFFQF